MLKQSNRYSAIYKYLATAVLLVVPLYQKFPLVAVPGTFVSIRLEDLLLGFSAMFVGLYFFRQPQALRKGEIARSVILYLFIGAISVVSGIFVTKTIVWHIGVLHWLRRIEYMIPLFLGYLAIKLNKNSLEFFYKLITLVIIFAFVYGFGQKHIGWPIVITQNAQYSTGIALRWIPGSHINSTFAGHYDLATFLVLVMPVIVASVFVLKGIRTRTYLGTVVFAGLWLLVNSASRISLVSYMLSAVLALAFVRKYKAIPIVIIVSVLFIGFSSNLLSRYTRLIDVGLNKLRSQENIINYIPRVNEAFAIDEDALLEKRKVTPTPTPVVVVEDRSTNIRLNVEWPRAIRALKKNPLLGTGYSSITLATDNDYLRALGEVGVLGFAAFSLIIVRIIEKFSKAMPFTGEKFKTIESVILAGIFGSFVGVFVNAVFIDVFEASKFATIFWLIVGIALGVINNKYNEKYI